MSERMKARVTNLGMVVMVTLAVMVVTLKAIAAVDIRSKEAREAAPTYRLEGKELYATKNATITAGSSKTIAELYGSALHTDTSLVIIQPYDGDITIDPTGEADATNAYIARGSAFEVREYDNIATLECYAAGNTVVSIFLYRWKQQ